MIYKSSLQLALFLICFLLELMLTGCSSQRNIPAGDRVKTPGWKNLYYFHAGDSTWIVKPIPATGNHFSGVIFRPDEITKHSQVRIYADPLSAVKIEEGVLSVPMENIVQVDNFRISAGMVITIAAVLALLFLVPVYL